jgi:hypothetical protein
MREPKVVTQEPAALLGMLWSQQSLEDRFGGQRDREARSRPERKRRAWRSLAAVVSRRPPTRRPVPSTEGC